MPLFWKFYLIIVILTPPLLHQFTQNVTTFQVRSVREEWLRKKVVRHQVISTWREDLLVETQIYGRSTQIEQFLKQGAGALINLVRFNLS